MEKVVFIDVDGTLRNDKQEISERTLKVLEKVKEKNYEPILCTGRPLDYAKKLNDIINGSQYIIYNNGAGIYDGGKNEVLYENPMKVKSLLELYSFIKDNLRFILSCNGTRYVNMIKHHDGSETLFDLPLDKFLQNNKVIALTIASPDWDIIKKLEHQINNVESVKIINRHKSLVDSDFPRTGTIFYDIIDVNSSKGNAVKYFCNMFNISKKNRIAIGDDSNDISMFDECGTKVAMGNALPALKKIADYITDDNNNDGVAKFLEQLLND